MQLYDQAGERFEALQSLISEPQSQKALKPWTTQAALSFVIYTRIMQSTQMCWMF